MVDFKNIRFYSRFRPNNPTNYLLANIGEKLRIEIDIECSTYALSDNTSNAIIANYTNSVIGGQWIYDPRGQFKDFQIGDELEHKNYSNNTAGPPVGLTITVLDKLSDYLIQIDQDITGGAGTNIALGTSILSVKTPITGMDYQFNFIGNAETNNFFSKVDGSNQIARAQVIDATALQTSGPLVVGTKYIITDFNAGDDFTNVGAASNATGVSFIATGTTPTVYANGSTLNVLTQMTFLGAKPYQIGSAEIYGRGINTSGVYGYQFTIVHETVLTPFFLSPQWQDLLNKIAPDYYFDTECLKGIFACKAYFDFNDPNRITTGESSELEGNSGWFNENFNTGLTNYYVDDIVYTISVPTTTIVPGISLSANETTVTITLKNTVDAPFSNNNTRFSLNFCKAPLNDTEYTVSTKTLQENFLFDTAFNTVGAAAVDGENFGTAYQILKDVEATFVSSSEIEITALVDMDASVLSDLLTLDEARYILFVGIQNHLHDTTPPAIIDATTLLADAQDFYEDLTDPGMIVFDKYNYLRHFESNPVTEGTMTCEAYKEDEIVNFMTFYVDHTGRTTNTIELFEITAKLTAKNSSTLAEFDLDKWTLPLSGFPSIGGDTYMDVTYQRPFHIPAGEIRKEIKLKRTTNQDVGLKKFYALQFPFMVRWEYFLPLLSADYDFFDTGEPNNGLNNDWFRLQDLFVNWKVYYEIKIKAKKDGVVLNYSFEDQITIYNYDNPAPDFQRVSVKSYDPDTSTELYDPIGNERFILGYKYTLIEAIFKNETNPIDVNACHFHMHIEVFEDASAGVNGTRRISSVWVLDQDTWFSSVDGSGKIVKTLIPASVLVPYDQIKISAYVDFTKIPLNKKKFKIEPRLFDSNSISPLARVTEDGIDRIIEGVGGDVRIIEA